MRQSRVQRCEPSCAGLAEFGPTIEAGSSIGRLRRDSPRRLFDGQAIREAALLTFVDPLPSECLVLERISRRDWMALLKWLDYSGLALYFLDRVIALRLESMLPASVRERLHENLRDNQERTRGMMAESVGIQQEFQRAGLRYANLKGFCLVPRSVPRPELRSQFDLDYLVAEESAARARTVLEDRGYRLYAASARSWEFKRNERPGFSLRDLYRDLQSWRVELHIESSNSAARASLDHREWQEWDGIWVPVLPPIDAFFGQGLHAFKHLCGEFSRASHLLEFRRHVLSRRADHRFWNELHRSSRNNLRARIGIGLVTLLITQVMGEFAPDALIEWTVPCLPENVRLWVAMYGHRAVLGSFPGTKLYLLLQSALEDAGMPAKRRVLHSLLPSRLPPALIRSAPDETLSFRIARYSMHFGHILSRSRFHVVEGLRYAWQQQRWRRVTKQNAG